MTTYSKTVFNFRTSQKRGFNMPIKYCGDIKFNFWSFVVDDMVEHLRYLKEDFVVRDDDVYICTYPRSGTNWTHEIVQMLLHGSSDFAPLFAFVDNSLPVDLENIPSPRVMCSHLPLEFLPPKIRESAKVICVFRNPKDNAVSLHTFQNHLNFLDYNASWSDYLQLFLDGEVPCGKWFNHVQNWEKVIAEKKVKSILPVKYEDLKFNLRENVERIAKFLGVQHGKDLLDEISDKCTFKVQYKERTTNVHEIIKGINKNSTNFLYRKGEVAEWKNWFTVAQNEQFDKIYEEEMKNSNLKFRFC